MLIYFISFLFLFFTLTFVSLSSISFGPSIFGRTLNKLVRGINIFQGGGDSSFLARFLIIKYSFSNISNLVIGTGPGGAESFLIGSNPLGIVNPHSFFLEILINYGFIGFILSLFIFIHAFLILKKIFLITNNINIKASAAGGMSIILLFPIVSVVSSSLLKDWAFAWLPISLAYATLGSFRRSRHEYSNSYS
ncbi:O-antigen ligase family protein [Thiospirochaeta perfilievii]|uniref:O-antigen ligase family protein n=1 Tax=Thiospirochaeta perfilievii TaxID=252967 RepID=UPI001659C029|nr:O-antigen ligase family protein [Thiospirochaeta perfilievii]